MLHGKNEALDKFKIYKSKIELKEDLHVKQIRTDKDGEYNDRGYFQTNGIIHETTMKYAPLSNGVSKRKNRTL